MKESDWKLFKKIKNRAMDQYCQAALSEFSEIIDKEDQSAHERYLYLYKIIDNTNRKMSLLFDGHSRSKAMIQLLVIRREGLADDQLVSELSEAFQQETDPSSIKW